MPINSFIHFEHWVEKNWDVFLLVSSLILATFFILRGVGVI